MLQSRNSEARTQLQPTRNVNPSPIISFLHFSHSLYFSWRSSLVQRRLTPSSDTHKQEWRGGVLVSQSGSSWMIAKTTNSLPCWIREGCGEAAGCFSPTHLHRVHHARRRMQLSSRKVMPDQSPTLTVSLATRTHSPAGSLQGSGRGKVRRRTWVGWGEACSRRPG